MEQLQSSARLIPSKQMKLSSRTKSFNETRLKISPLTIRHSSLSTPIHRDCLRLINQKAPNKLLNILKNKGLTKTKKGSSCKPKDNYQQSLHHRVISQVFQEEYSREQSRFIRMAQRQRRQRQQLRVKLRLIVHPQKQGNIERSSISYFERHFPQSEKALGRYRQRMHPLCSLYQKQSDRFMSFRRRLAVRPEEL